MIVYLFIKWSIAEWKLDKMKREQEAERSDANPLNQGTER